MAKEVSHKKETAKKGTSKQTKHVEKEGNVKKTPSKISKTVQKKEDIKKGSQQKKSGVSNKKTIVNPTTEEKKIVKTKKGKAKRIEMNNVSSTKSDEITKLVEVVLVILVILAAFYLITTWVTKSKNSSPAVNKSESEDKVIQYDEILLGNLLSQSNDEYYVLVTTKDNNASYYKTLIATYKEKENSFRFYTSSLDNSFNKKFKQETSNLYVENIKDLKVKQTTLFKIKNHQIEEAIEGIEVVANKLDELAK